MKLTRGFVLGKMNKDLDERLIPRGEYRDALNVGVSAAQTSDVGAIENQLGNTNLSALTLGPNPVAIGALADPANFDIYWLVTSDTFDYLFRYNENTGATTTLLKDTKGRVLKFNKKYLVTGINIINDLLFWTDNLNTPKRLNVNKNYATDGFTEDDISVIVRPPLYAPTIALSDTINVGGISNRTGEENNISKTFIEFSYRYKYENDEYSAIAPYSSAAFYPGLYQYNYPDWELTSMINIYNEAQIRFHLGGDQVKEIQLLFKESESTNINVIDSYKYQGPYTWSFNDNIQASAYATALGLPASQFPGNVGFTTSQVINGAFSNVVAPIIFEVGDEIVITQTAGFTHSAYEGTHVIVELLGDYAIIIDVLFAGATGVEPGEIVIETKTQDFINNKIYTILPSDENGRLFDNVPLKAQAQDLIGSRIAYGNYVQFFNLQDSVNNQIELDFDLQLATLPITSQPLPTFRSDRDYEIGIAYLDDYGRMTTVLTSHQNTIYIAPANSTTANDIRVNVYNRPPAFASHYRFFIKQAKGDYYNIFPLYFYIDGLSRYFAIGPSDLNKVKEGDYVICKTKNSTPTLSNKTYKVLEVKAHGRGFIDGGNQARGVYIKITDAFADFTLGNQFTYSFSGGQDFTSNPASLQGDVYVQDQFLGRGCVSFPIFYGSSTSANALIPTAVPGYTPHESTRSGSSYRYKVSILDGSNNTFEYFSQSQDGTYTLVETNLTMVGTGVGNELKYLYNGVLYRLCNVRFAHLPNTYKTGDYWIVNIHGNDMENLDGTIPNTNRPPHTHGIAVFPGDNFNASPVNSTPNYKDRTIFLGARIEIKITEYKNGSVLETPIQTWYSSREYTNLEEWFWEDQVFSTFKHQSIASGLDVGAQNVFFKRGFGLQGASTLTNSVYGALGGPTPVNYSPGYTSWAEYKAYEASVRMFISSSGSTNMTTQADLVGIKVEFNIVQSPDIIIFETEPSLNPPEIYHELNQTFKITGGAHQGNRANQILNTNAPAEISLNPSTLTSATTFDRENSNFNAYCFGNGLEALRIRAGWNEYALKYSPRASGVIEDYQQQRVEEGITYSGVYRENTGINNLNEFNLSLGNYKYLDRFFGSIQKLHSRDTDLVVFQENKISKVLYGKNLLSDAVGGGSVVSIPEVLGTQVSYAGEFGISTHPESFATWGNNMYFTDVRRGAVLKLGADGAGVVPISSYGMKNYFKDFSIQGRQTQKIGGFDPFKLQYVLSTNTVEDPCEFAVSFEFSEFSEPFNLGSTPSLVTAYIQANGNWTVTLVDTGDGTAWVVMNNTAGTTLSGTGNGVINFVYAGNTSGSNRGLDVRFAGCDEVITYSSVQSKRKRITVIGTVIGGASGATEFTEADQLYDFTSNATGGDIKYDATTFKSGKVAYRNRFQNIGGVDSVPTPGDTVTLKGTELGTTTQRPFNPNLGNTIKYLVSNDLYTEQQVNELMSAATNIPAVLAGGVYSGGFTYLTPNDEIYLYLIWNYTNEVAVGSAMTMPSGMQGTTYTTIDYGTALGKSIISYNANAVTNRFVLKSGGVVVADTGFVAGAGTIDFIKTAGSPQTAELSIETSGLDDGWTYTAAALSLTSFLIDTTNDTAATVCPRVPATTYYHDGSAALPVDGDFIYTDATGLLPYNGANSFHKMGAGDDYIFVATNGQAGTVGSCAACAEVAAPVLTIPDFSFETVGEIAIQLSATNNPVEFAIVTTCQSYTLDGGTTGGVYTCTYCDSGGTFEANVPMGENTTVCSKTVPVLVTGSDASSTLLGNCEDDVLPFGLSLGKTTGLLSGSIQQQGVYPITVTATNCFGTSINNTFIVTVGPQSQYRRFYMDDTVPKDNADAACDIPSTAQIYYHDGDATYPQVNNYIYYLNEFSGYDLYNGGFLWFLVENNEAIQIDNAGQVVDVSICGSTKSTAAGNDKTTEDDLDKTIE